MKPAPPSVHARPRVVHLTSVHPPLDDRIFYRECLTLANAGYDVAVIAQSQNDAVISGIRIRAVPKTRGRLARLLQTIRYVYRTALQEAPAIYHFHDPELIPIGLLLRWKGYTVIYDVHEDVPEDVLTKEWIPRVFRLAVSWLMVLLHRVVARKFSATISATTKIAQGFEPHGSIVIHNYPLLDTAGPSRQLIRERPHHAVYIGSISKIRGISEMVTGMFLVENPPDARLILCGAFEDVELEENTRQNVGWSKVTFLGWRDRHEVELILENVRVGLLLFHPGPNHTEALPAKLFEYMMAGLPIIASDFPLWRSIIEGAECGMLIDPLDPSAIGKAISYVLTHPEEAEKMGSRGRAAVMARYNWDSEAPKLLEVYSNLV